MFYSIAELLMIDKTKEPYLLVVSQWQLLTADTGT